MSARSKLGPVIKQVVADAHFSEFTRSQLRLVRTRAEMCSLIELQPSRDGMAFVVNFGVQVLALRGTFIEPGLTMTSCHFQGRVSDATGREVWRTVPEQEEAHATATWLRDVLLAEVLPILDRYDSEASLIALWQTDKGPGLPRPKRLELLGRLLHRAGRLPEFEQLLDHLLQNVERPLYSSVLSELRSLQQEPR
jgi:hypothetical protein